MSLRILKKPNAWVAMVRRFRWNSTSTRWCGSRNANMTGSLQASLESGSIESMQVPLLDLKAQYRQIRAAVMAALEAVCDEQAFILGARVADLEKDIQKYVGVSQA